MMNALLKEKQTMKNWKAVILRVQMINSFKLSMRTIEQDLEEKQVINFKQEQAWWEAGQFIIYPESKIGILWGLLKTVTISLSMFTFTYNAAFLFSNLSDVWGYELIFDFVQFFDIIITFFTARLSRDISESTRQLFEKKKNGEDAVVASIKFETQWEVNVKVIIIEYLKTNFWTDFLACVPLIVTSEKVVWLFPLKILRVTRISRVVTFLQMFSQIIKDQY